MSEQRKPQVGDRVRVVTRGALTKGRVGIVKGVVGRIRVDIPDFGERNYIAADLEVLPAEPEPAKTQGEEPPTADEIAEAMCDAGFKPTVEALRIWLDEWYPQSIFDGSSGDIGPEVVVGLRAVLDRYAERMSAGGFQR